MKNYKESVDNKSAQMDSEESLFEVEKIIEKKVTPEGELYLIKWKNYPDPADYTWEPLNHLDKVKNLIKKFNSAKDKKKELHLKKQKDEWGSEKAVIEIESDSAPKKERQYRPNRFRQTLPKEKKIAKLRPENQASKKEKVQPDKSSKPSIEREPSTGQRKLYEKENDLFWQREGLILGRIHKHFYRDGKLMFDVNVNNHSELICGSTLLTLDELMIDYEEKVVDYMQNWSQNSLIQKKEINSEEFKQFQQFWKEIQ